MVPFNLKELAKFGLCSDCSQKLDECSLDHTRKIFATAHVLGFSLKCARFLYGWETCTRMDVSGNKHPLFAGVLLKLTLVRIIRERHPQR